MRKIYHVVLLATLTIPCDAGAVTENLTQLIADARVLALDAASTTRQRFSDAQITEFLNQAQRLAVDNTRCLQSNVIFQLVPGTTFYSLPANYLSVNRVTVGSKWLQEMSPAAMDGRSRGWESASGYPTYYFVNFSSRGLVGFAPWPAASTDTDTVKVEFNIAPTDLVNGSDVPFNAVGELAQYYHALAFYAAAMMEAIEGLNTQSQAYMTVFQGQVKNMDDHCTERPNYLPSATGTP